MGEGDGAYCPITWLWRVLSYYTVPANQIWEFCYSYDDNNNHNHKEW